MDYDEKMKAYYSLFRNTDFGPIILMDLMDRFYKSTFIKHPINPDELLLDVGGREVIVYILSLIEEYENSGRG